MTVTNTPMYYYTEIITTIIRFIVQPPGACTKQNYGFIIYGKFTDFIVS
jgi:hypothetical protein